MARECLNKCQNRIEEIKRLKRAAARVYVVERFNDIFLSDVKSGWPFKFDEWVGSYLDDEEDRNEVLRQVNRRDSINALIDENNRVMYSLGSRRRRWLGSYIPLIGLFIGGLLALIVDAQYFHLVQSSISLEHQIAFYSLTLTGFGAHIAKKSLDQRKDNAAVGDIPLWLHVKAATYIPLAAGLVALFFSLLSQNQMNAFLAFTLGYSADSLVSRFAGHYYGEMEKATKIGGAGSTKTDLGCPSHKGSGNMPLEL